MLQKINNDLTSGILLACMPKSGSTFTANRLAQAENVRLANIVLGILDDAAINIKMLATALSQNKNSSFVAQSHILCSSLTLELIEKKYLVPLVLTRNLPDAIISMIDHQIASGVRISDIEQKCEHYIHLLVPWYLKFFASWIEYSEFKKVWLRYEDLSKNNQKYFNKITSILGIEDMLVERPLQKKNISADNFISNSHFNKGVNGRGHKIMSARQMELIRKLIILSEIPYEYWDYLLTGNIEISSENTVGLA